nr:RHS repeat-associated core domain-containing protein [Lysobacter sp. GX 14042]
MTGVILFAGIGAANAKEIRYIHTDALGSVVAVTDVSRFVTERREYEPYGTQNAPTLNDGAGYTGHVEDSATGLIYMQQRYYDPGIGRFLSVDPVTALDSGDMRLFNRYAYAFNNPYTFIDPDGRASGAAAKDMGRMIRALWNSKGDPDKFGQLYKQYADEGRAKDKIILDVGADLTSVGILKDAGEVTIEVANDGDATGQGAGALVGEAVGAYVEKKLDGKIGGDAASAAGAAAGMAIGDAVEAGVNRSSSSSSGAPQPQQSAPTPINLRDQG